MEKLIYQFYDVLKLKFSFFLVNVLDFFQAKLIQQIITKTNFPVILSTTNTTIIYTHKHVCVCLCAFVHNLAEQHNYKTQPSKMCYTLARTFHSSNHFWLRRWRRRRSSWRLGFEGLFFEVQIWVIWPPWCGEIRENRSNRWNLLECLGCCGGSGRDVKK